MGAPVNSLRTRRPVEEENLSLSLLNSVRDNGRLCVKFASQGDHMGTENPVSAKGSFDVSLILSKLYV